jgi:hypothetical protein
MDKTTQTRPGRTTSEFIVTAALALILVAAAVVGFAVDKLSWQQGLEVLGIGLGLLGLGYNAARGLAKMGPLKGLLLMVGLGGMLTGCGVTFKSALEGIHKGGKLVSTSYEPGLQAKCMEAARKCKGKVMKVEECTPYITCRDIQRLLASGLQSVHEGNATMEKARRRAVAAGLLKDGE